MKLLLKIIGALAVVLVLALGFLFFKFDQLAKVNYTQQVEINIKDSIASADIELGKRIYTIRNGCIDCHGENLAGAKIMDDPAMGSIFGANITPYTLNSWSDDEIARAIRYGVHKSGQSLKFMPSFDFEGLSKEDIAAVIKYIRSVPPVEQPSHNNSFGPASKVLAVLGKMPVMFSAQIIDQSKGFAEKPAEAPTADFGKYLVNSCVGCHGKDLKGGKIIGGDPSWPEASNLRFGQSTEMTEAKFEEIITSGISNQTKNKIRLPMPIAALQAMNQTERKSIWLYLSSLN